MSEAPDTFPDKHPEAIRVASINWAAELQEGETIDGSTWDVYPDDNTLVTSNDDIDAVNKITMTKLTGGTLGAQYKLINTITTPFGKLVSVKLLNIRDNAK